MKLLLAEAATLMAVAAQNRWPFDPASLEEMNSMSEAASILDKVVRDLRKIGSGEQQERRDPTLAAALGTLGRTIAFIGKHREARRFLYEARKQFSSTRDLVVNGIYLAHVELDSNVVVPSRFEKALILVVQPEERSPEYFATRLAAGDLASRFALNVLLKAIASRLEVWNVDTSAWIASLTAEGSGTLYDLLCRMRSHPTELVARHAAEVLKSSDLPQAAARWFELGISVGREGGQTLERLAQFTEHLALGRAPSGPRGAILNPCYEYR